MAQSVNIGELIRRRLDESEITYTEFARKIHCERQSLYYLFKCKSIDVDKLILISKVLNYDFLRRHYLNESPAAGTIESEKALVINLSPDELKEVDKIVLTLPSSQKNP